MTRAGYSSGRIAVTPTGRARVWQSVPMGLDVDRVEALSFDCYGTLIDWERGLLEAAHALLAAHGASPPDEDILASFARHEARLEAGPYLRYRDLLAGVAASIAAEHDVSPGAEELAAFGGSVVDWPAFPDSADALARLGRRFRLAVVTNCDDDLFAASARRLGDPFEVVVTAEQARSYKPAPRHFELLFERLALSPERIVHVAQSLFHDHVPAQVLGLRSVWVERRRGRAGGGATPHADARPDLVVPDMATLAGAVLDGPAAP
jgi:2-haloacid dehalogenase